MNKNNFDYDVASSLATITHEFGHAFGLDENNSNQDSIMCQGIYGRLVSTVQDVDHWAFVKKHP